MTELTNIANESLNNLFHPRSIAVVGVSKNPESQASMYLRQLLEFPFKGKIYPVSREASEIQGQQCVQSLRQIPEQIDYVISCIPHHQVLSLVDDCQSKGVRCLHLYTARMAETQLDDRKGLERDIVQKARRAGIRIIGPNCMGLYCPEAGLTFRSSLPREEGPIAFISQSGGNAVELDYQGSGRGLRYSKIISFGNGSDLNESDFLEYLLGDEKTKAIGLYLEGVKDGRRFLDLLRQNKNKKPIVLYKAGRTEAGTRAVISHTASMSGHSGLWEAVCRQFGIIAVDSIREMADTLLAFQFLPPAPGRRIMVIGGGGGSSVAAADIFESEGFDIPPLPRKMKEDIHAIDPEVALLMSNPMDGSALGGMQTILHAYTLGFNWDGADLIMANTSAIWLLDDENGVTPHDMGLAFMMDLAQKIRNRLSSISIPVMQHIRGG